MGIMNEFEIRMNNSGMHKYITGSLHIFFNQLKTEILYRKKCFLRGLNQDDFLWFKLI